MKTNGSAGRIKTYRENLNFIKNMIEENGQEVVEVKISFTQKRPFRSMEWNKKKDKQDLQEFIEELVKWGRELK